MPIGTSTSPVLFILPTRENILVPLLPSVPICEYQSAPRLIIKGTFAQVSTLLRLEGLPLSPLRDLYIEAETRTEDMLAEQAIFSCLLKRYSQVGHCKGIFIPNIDISVM